MLYGSNFCHEPVTVKEISAGYDHTCALLLMTGFTAGVKTPVVNLVITPVVAPTHPML